MPKIQPSMAREIAQLIQAAQSKQTGHAPEAVTVVLNQDTVVVTLHDAMTDQDRAAATTPDGAARVRTVHRQKFADASKTLKHQIQQITGVAVSDANIDVEPTTGTIVAAFTSGTVLQTFLLSREISGEAWQGGVESQQSAGPPSP